VTDRGVGIRQESFQEFRKPSPAACLCMSRLRAPSTDGCAAARIPNQHSNNEREKFRMMKHVSGAAVAALALGAGLAFAAPARADTQGFLDYMRSHGYANQGPTSN
jgi:hypothetical protein